MVWNSSPCGLCTTRPDNNTLKIHVLSLRCLGSIFVAALFYDSCFYLQPI